MAYDRELEAALTAARLASQTVLDRYASFEKVENAPANIATEADRDSQELILEFLQQAFPGDAYCAEEKTPSLEKAAHTGPRLWIVDPIDGTRGFAQKNDEFSVMIAFVERGTIGVGVVAEPALGRTTYAVKGGGCWKLDGDGAAQRCRVSDRAALAESRLIQSRSRDPGVPTEHVQALRPKEVIETYSAGIKLARVARGEADLYVNRYAKFHDWDIAAGHILVTEAGGTVTGLQGETLVYGQEGAWQRSGLLATNGKLHALALEKLLSM